jgi:uncharacterized OB-fold protein
MPYYKICEKCGASLDPGEKCTCEKDKREEAEEKKFKKMIEITQALILNSKPKRRRRR